LESLQFAKLISELTKIKKAYNIKIIDLKNVSNIADYFVICSADSDRQVKAIADEVDKNLIERGIKCFHREGYETLNWIIMDYFDVVLHIFRAESRNYYNLEKLWGDAPTINIPDN
jgi:ribosome-associated protein